MDRQPKQMRVKFSGLSKTREDAYNTQEERKSLQNTTSYDKERKKEKSWFQQQYTYQKNEEDSNLELRTAIAAAAYAIMLAEEGPLSKKKTVDELGSSLKNVRSKREDSANRSTDNKFSRWLGSKPENLDDGKVAEKNSKRKSLTLGESMTEEFGVDVKLREKEMSSTTSIKKSPTFSHKFVGDADKKSSDLQKDKKIEQSYIPTITSMPSLSTSGYNNGDRIAKAYNWELAKMEKIRKRYQKMNNNILQWENEKKVKARHRKERKERTLERKRMHILQEFREEMKRIDLIASGARAVADEARKNDEQNAKKKAEEMRSSLKVHLKCFCF